MAILVGSEITDTAVASQFGGTVFGFTIFGGTPDDLVDDRGDLFRGFGGIDQISAGPGNDTFEIYGGDDPDNIDGNAGNDFLFFVAVSDSIFINAPGNVYTLSTFIGDFLIESVEVIQTGIGNDTIIGTAASERFISSFGNDILSGGDGRDSLFGEENADSIAGGAGNDSISGGTGNDQLNGDADSDFIHGESDADTLNGGAGIDTLNGGLGLDLIDGGTEIDTVSYSDRADGGINVNIFNGITITGGFINSGGFYQGGNAEDTLQNLENIIGTAFADRLVGGSSAARIEGAGGNDVISSFSGRDTILGGDGNDRISAGEDRDQLLGGTGNDTLNGGLGTDTLNGGTEVDAADYIDRNAGVSVNLFNAVTITGGSLNSSGLYSGGSIEDSLVSIESAIGSNFADRLVASNSNSRLEGNGGGDNISGLNGADTLIGGAGNDTLGGGAGNDVFVFEFSGGFDAISDFAEGSAVSDVISLVGFGIAFDTFSEVIAAATQVGTDVLFSFSASSTLSIAGATISGFNANDFAFG